MKKPQIVLVSIGLLLMTLLYSLPRQIVKKSGVSQESLTDSMDTLHASMQLSGAEQAYIDQLRQNWQKSSGKTRWIWSDSLHDTFWRIGRYDSAAYYAEWKASQSQEWQDQLRAADAYYQAFEFAMSAERAAAFADKARQLYEQVLRKQPNQLDARARMAMTYITTPQPMVGIQQLLDILRKEPDHPLALYNLGVLSMQRAAYDKAIERFEHLIRVKPDELNAYLLLAESYLNLERPQQARQTLQKALQYADTPALRKQIEQALQNIP